MDKDKQNLLGEISLKKRTQKGNLTDEDIHILATPLTGEEVIYVLCKKHFPVFPIKEDGRIELLSSYGQSKPTEWTGKYFEVSGCPFCTDEGKFENPVLKDFRSS